MLEQRQLRSFLFFLFPLFSRRMNSHFCFMQSLWALRAVFLYAVKLKRTIFTLKLHFLESLCLGLVRRGIWVRKQLSPCISLCLRAEKSHVSKWESRHKLHGANTLTPSPLQKTLPNIVGWVFFLSQKALLYAHYICRASLSPPETLIGRYPASLLFSPPNQFSLQHLCTCSEYKPLKMDVMRVCLIALRERKLCMPHFQRGGMPSEEGRGVSVDHSRATVYGKPAILAGFL